MINIEIDTIKKLIILFDKPKGIFKHKIGSYEYKILGTGNYSIAYYVPALNKVIKTSFKPNNIQYDEIIKRLPENVIARPLETVSENGLVKGYTQDYIDSTLTLENIPKDITFLKYFYKMLEHLQDLLNVGLINRDYSLTNYVILNDDCVNIDYGSIEVLDLKNTQGLYSNMISQLKRILSTLPEEIRIPYDISGETLEDIISIVKEKILELSEKEAL